MTRIKNSWLYLLKVEKITVMSKHQIKFYPVDNGDTSLLKLSDGTNILVDCKLREGEETESGSKIFNVKGDLLSELPKRDKNVHLDVFIVTHPDNDHLLGFKKNFYFGKPEDFGDSNRENEEIIIDELWVTSMVFKDCTNEDAKSLKREAERRRKLWQNDSRDKDAAGNRLRLIGYDAEERFQSLPNSIPGETINKFNGKVLNNFELFVHAPFKESLINGTAEKDQNFCSIVMQARFKIKPDDKDVTCRFLFGGDADHYIWAEVLNKTESHKNSLMLEWDIFLAPHHCSWTFFNNVPYGNPEENKNPKASALKILDYKRTDAMIIASSKVIINNDDNPPHFKAKEQYLTKVKSSKFLNTAEEPNKKEPQPIVFEISNSGISRIDNGAKAEGFRQIADAIKVGLVGTASTGRLSGMADNVVKHQPHKFYGE